MEKSHNATSLFKIVEKRRQLLDSGQYDKLGADDHEPCLSKKNSAIFNKSFSQHESVRKATALPAL